MLEKLKNWQGNLENLIDQAERVSSGFRLKDTTEISVRMVRDYIQRGILGEIDRSGRELAFNYSHLLKLVLSRVLLNDGWSLKKIGEHFEFTEIKDLEELLPKTGNTALSAIKRLRSSIDGAKPRMSREPQEEGTFAVSRQAARRTSIQQEMQSALRKIGLPEDGPATEEITLIAITPWFQALLQKDRIRSLTLEEAEEIGKAVSASLTKLILKRGERK
jgi:DNA-binding transcriptional MerR regulator